MTRQRQCPFCRELIISDAIKCKHCGSVLVPTPSVAGLGLRESSAGPVNIVNNIPNTLQAHSTTPERPPETYSGNGISGLVVTILFFLLIVGTYDEFNPMRVADEMFGLALINIILVVPWMSWVLSRPHSNKVLPIISLSITFINLLIALGAGA